MALTDTAIRNAKPREKIYKISDEKGLYLEIRPNGAKYWRLKYRVAGKEKRISLGVYPTVSLKEARNSRDEKKKLLEKGIDPSQERKARKHLRAEQAANSFEAVAREWHEKRAPSLAESHASKIFRRLEIYIFPLLGSRPISEITPPELLAVMRKVENLGILETAHRVLQTCSQVFRYAITTGRANRDVAADLRGALPPAQGRHRAAITDPREVGGLLRAIDVYPGNFVTACALRLAPHVFLRPGELRQAEWSEIDLDAAEWRIPAAKMKMKAPHIVPLSRQAVAILREIQPLTGRGNYVFPSIRTNERPMSNATILGALRRLGYEKDEMSSHGFRHMASTLLHELGFPSHLIEKQLSHGDRSRIRATYNFAEFLPERRKMMQAWSDYLDQLKAGAKVIPIGHQKMNGHY